MEKAFGSKILVKDGTLIFNGFEAHKGVERSQIYEMNDPKTPQTAHDTIYKHKLDEKDHVYVNGGKVDIVVRRDIAEEAVRQTEMIIKDEVEQIQIEDKARRELEERDNYMPGQEARDAQYEAIKNDLQSDQQEREKIAARPGKDREEGMEM